ncbi:hypothetical protein [Yoonia sp. 2307UL14-13]|uniref:hypothetical protein n=1 Tax=Yoonia sp. 2307UL14-13 TaxID=3126506 RepID=UPI0030A691F3
MFRLIMLVLGVAAIVTLVVALITVISAVGRLARPEGEDTMPRTFQRIAFVVLFILLIGLATGWLGAV